MRFGANQFKINRRFPRATVAVSLLALVLGGVAGYAFFEKARASSALESKKVELRAANEKVLDLGRKLEQSKLDLQNQVASTKEVCRSNTTELETQVASFAKQAGACEHIRIKLAIR